MRLLRPMLCLPVMLLLSACAGETPPDAATPATVAAAQSDAAPVPAAPTDEAGLRAAAASALSDQRLYSPVSDNAVEHYLALRALVPGDPNVETALVELLPYALIGSEQAIARGDFTEARRLVGLVERADAELPALSRLRDSLVAAEAEAEKAAQAAEEEAARRAEAERLAAADADQARERAASAPPSAATSPVRPAPAPVPMASAPAPAVAATPAPPRPAVPATAPVVPKLVSAPQPRYPLMALRRKLEGEVLLELSIRPDGSVGSARVVSATPPGLFDEAAVAAAERWRFEQAAAPATTRQVLRFRLPREGAQPAS